MITTSQPGRIDRRDHRYHDQRPRVTLNHREMAGHHILHAAKFLLTDKKGAHDGKVILRFESQMAMDGSQWGQVTSNGVLRIPVDAGESRMYMEGSCYVIYLYQW